MSLRFHLLSLSKKFWHRLAAEAEREGLNLVFDRFGDIHSLSLPSIRKVVIRTYTLRNHWRSLLGWRVWAKKYTVPIPNNVRSQRPTDYTIDLTDDFLLIRKGYRKLIVINRRNGRCIGRYNPDPWSVFYNYWWHNRSTYVVYTSLNADELRYGFKLSEFSDSPSF